MRLHEIDSNTDRNAIKRKFMDNFRITQGDPNYINIDHELLVNLNGDCELIKPCSKLPVKFGDINGSFKCSNSNLTSLEGSPRYVKDGFDCSNNNITSLEGGPDVVQQYYDCSRNKLTSLVGLPKILNGNLIANNTLTSLEGLPSEINGYCELSYTPNLPLLRICFSKIYNKVYLYDENNGLLSDDTLENLLNKYVGRGRKGAIQCAAEMTKAGYKGNAKL